MAESNAYEHGDGLCDDVLFRDEQIVVRPTDVTTSRGLFALGRATRYEVRGGTRTAIALLLVASVLVPFTHLSDLGRAIGSPAWVATMAGILGLASFVALVAGLAGSRTIVLKRPTCLSSTHQGVRRELSHEVAIYSSRNERDIRAVLDALTRAPKVQEARLQRARKEKQAHEQKQWRAKLARRVAKQQQDEARYQELLKKSAAQQAMPFKTWASSQKPEDLWLLNPKQLAVYLDNVYGGPGVVDRFHQRAMKHALRADIYSVKSGLAFAQVSQMNDVILERVSLGEDLTAGERNPQRADDDRKKLRAMLREMACIAKDLQLMDLQHEYLDLVDQLQ